MEKFILIFVVILTVFSIASMDVLAADSNKGAFKGNTWLKVSRDLTPADAVFWRLSTDASEGSSTDPKHNNWDFPAGGSITLTLTNSSTGTPPHTPNGDARDSFEILAYYENDTTLLIRNIYSGTRVPANGTKFVINATSNMIGTSAARAGIVRIYIFAHAEETLQVTWETNSDSGTITGGNVFDSTYAQGALRASLNVTNFTTYKDSAYTQNETRFMRGETVYLEFKTDASAWNNTGNETFELRFGDQKAVFNATQDNNTYRTSWTMDPTTSLNYYDATLFIKGRTGIFGTPYREYISDPGTDLIIENGSTTTLSGKLTYRNVVLKNNSKIAVGAAGNLTLQADKTITVESGSSITANGVGGAGGAGGASNDAQCISNNGQTGTGSGGGGGGSGSVGTTGGGGGAGGYGGAGGAGGTVSGAGGAAGATYGSNTSRATDKGSGGGGGGSACGGGFTVGGANGGGGGGTIVLEADENVTVHGTIEASGSAGSNVAAHEDFDASGGAGGGGSGGTIILNSTKVIVTGTVSAKGGDGGNATGVPTGGQGGGSGGGRIKIFALEADVQAPLLTTRGTAGSGGGASNNGADGTNVTQLGETWTIFNATSLGYKSNNLTNFSTSLFTDPDGVLSDRNATFWVEEEFTLVHDYGPRLNFSNSSTIGQYLMRGETLNYSFVVLDEWSRAFASKEINISFNSTAYSQYIVTVTTNSVGRVSGSQNITNVTTDTYANTTPGNLENKEYTLSVIFPSNNTDATRGSYGQNASQDYMFDVDATLYVDTHVQNSSTLSRDNLNDDNEQLSYKISEETVYVWAHVQNVRREELNARSVTTYVYSSEGSRGSPTATYTGTTGTDGWTPQLGSTPATTPAGDWYFDTDAGPDTWNNSGTDKETVTFTLTGVNAKGRVFFWENGTVVNAATVTVTVLDGNVELLKTTNVTDSAGKYDIIMDTTLVSAREYSVNVTITKGAYKSYVIQRFRA